MVAMDEERQIDTDRQTERPRERWEQTHLSRLHIKDLRKEKRKREEKRRGKEGERENSHI